MIRPLPLRERAPVGRRQAWIRRVHTVVRTRIAARLIVVDQDWRVLLFRFVHKRGALAGKDYWATPGGGVEPGESTEQAAVRELEEEVGLRIQHPGSEIGRRRFILTLADGEQVQADERYFLVRTSTSAISAAGLDDEERELIAGYRWWSLDELARSDAVVWPEGLADMLRAAPNGETPPAASPVKAASTAP